MILIYLANQCVVHRKDKGRCVSVTHSWWGTLLVHQFPPVSRSPFKRFIAEIKQKRKTRQNKVIRHTFLGRWERKDFVSSQGWERWRWMTGVRGEGESDRLFGRFKRRRPASSPILMYTCMLHTRPSLIPDYVRWTAGTGCVPMCV